MYKTKPMTNQNQRILTENYPSKGAKYCSEITGLPPKQITKWCNRNNIFVTKKRMHKKNCENIKLAHEANKNKPANKSKVNHLLFSEPKFPEEIYLLGLIWADGYINTKNRNLVVIESKKVDLEKLIPIFKHSGDWNISSRKRHNRSESLSIQTSNKRLTTFLIENDYDKKSLVSPDKILSKIPDNLKHYFFRGVIDGDGCFYSNIKNYCYQFSLAGSYEQDWLFFEKKCNDLGIQYGIARRTQKKSKNSIIRITNKKDIEKIGQYIYDGYPQDEIGLLRKYRNFKKILR